MSHGSSQDTKIEKKNFLNEIKKYIILILSMYWFSIESLDEYFFTKSLVY